MGKMLLEANHSEALVHAGYAIAIDIKLRASSACLSADNNYVIIKI